MTELISIITRRGFLNRAIGYDHDGDGLYTGTERIDNRSYVCHMESLRGPNTFEGYFKKIKRGAMGQSVRLQVG